MCYRPGSRSLKHLSTRRLSWKSLIVRSSWIRRILRWLSWCFLLGLERKSRTVEKYTRDKSSADVESSASCHHLMSPPTLLCSYMVMLHHAASPTLQQLSHFLFSAIGSRKWANFMRSFYGMQIYVTVSWWLHPPFWKAGCYGRLPCVWNEDCKTTSWSRTTYAYQTY